jgi:hypothetical protein
MTSASRPDSLAPLRWVQIRAEQLLFSGASASELGIHRALFFALVLAYSFVVYPAAWAAVSQVFWRPTYLFSFFSAPVASEATLTALTWTWRAALLLGVLGLYTRLATVVAFALGAYLIGLPHNFGKVHHNDAVLVLLLAVFAFARSGDGFSLDARRRAAREPFGGEYSWPLHLCRILASLVVFAAGVAKMRNGGLAWIFSDNLYYTILRHPYTHRPYTQIGLLFTAFPWMCNALAAFTIVVELSSPLLVVLQGWWRLLLLSLVVGMFLGFGITLGVLFSHYVLTLLILFLPWREIGTWLRARVGGDVTAGAQPGGASAGR